ncbi:MAG TPA: type IIL restriction-modification enzyme MmeI [Thermoanaerobaculia bacterium]
MTPADFVEKWQGSGAAERANAQPFLLDLCDVLGVERPRPATGDPELDSYTFERDAVLLHEGKPHTIGKMDLYKHGCFILEAKQGSHAGSKKIGTARRDHPATWNAAMNAAFGQALQYATTLKSPPPFIIVADIGYAFDIYATFDGSRQYRKFPDALNARIFLTALLTEGWPPVTPPPPPPIK